MKGICELSTGSWEVSVYLPTRPGKYRRWRRRYPTTEKAKEVYHRLKAAVAAGTWAKTIQEIEGNRSNVVTVSEIKDLYFDQYCKVNNRAVGTKKSRLKVLMEHFGNIPVDQLCHFDVTRYNSARKSRGAKGKNPKGVGNRTINRDLAVLKHMLTWAKEQGLIPDNPLANIRKLKEVSPAPPMGLWKAIGEVFRHLEASVKPLVTFILETGCRKGEALSLKHEQIFYDESLVLLTKQTKAGTQRYLLLNRKAAEATRALPKVGEYVFYNPETLTRWHDCKTPWERARKAAGYPHLNIKDLRTAFAMKLAEMPGMEKHVIQTLLGHSDLATTERFYAFHNQKRAIQRALQVIEGGKTAADESMNKVGHI